MFKADEVKLLDKTIKAVLSDLQTEDGCYCATGRGNTHTSHCLRVQRAVMALLTETGDRKTT